MNLPGHFAKRPPPVRLDRVPARVKAMVEAGGLPAYLGLFTEQERPERPLTQEPPAARAIFMLPTGDTGAGGVPEPSPVRQEVVTFDIMVEVAQDPEMKGGWDYAQALFDIHDMIYGVIQGEGLGIDDHEDVLPVYWCERMNSRPQKTENLGGWVQVVRYKAVVKRTA